MDAPNRALHGCTCGRLSEPQHTSGSPCTSSRIFKCEWYITVLTADGTSQIIRITIEGVDDVPTISGDITKLIDNTTATSTGTLTISDLDLGQSSFQDQTNAAGSYGTFSITSGAWTYQLDTTLPVVQALNVSDPDLTDTFTVTTADGTTQTVTISIDGTNNLPTVTGTSAATIQEGTATTDTTTTSTYTLTISDPDPGEGAFQTGQTGVTGTGNYGSLDLTVSGAQGNWIYTLDNTLTAIQALADGNSVTDTISLLTDDGNSGTHDVTITIQGTNDAPVLDNSGSMTLTAINSGTTTSSGSTVAQIISSAGGDRITDVDTGATEGIAVTQVDSATGTWNIQRIMVRLGLNFQSKPVHSMQRY